VYSKKAMPQLARIATNSGEDLYFRCPYHSFRTLGNCYERFFGVVGRVR
jgi:hypothetical protein